MAETESVSGKSRRGGIVLVAVVALIGAAWIVPTFAGDVAAAASSARERVGLMFMSDDEEVRRAVEEYERAWVYEGSSGDEFRARYSEAVTESYWDSPGGEGVIAWAELIDEDEDETFTLSNEIVGTRTLEREEDRRLVEVTFDNYVVVREDGEQEVIVDSTTRSQLRVVRTDGRWRVGWSGNFERLEDRLQDGS